MDISKKLNQLLWVLGWAMISVSAYLTYNHYMISPANSAGTLCNISSFLNCKAAATSQFSQFLGVPIAIFGIVTGLLTILAGFVKQPWIKQIYPISILNGIGCLVLGLYSILILESLCPFCTLYYIFSWAALFIISKKYTTLNFNPLHFIMVNMSYAVIFIAVYVSSFGHSTQPQAKADIKIDLYKQFLSYEKLPAPTMLSPLSLIKSKKEFKDNKLQILIFSDFQCPACKSIIPAVHAITTKYKENISFLYYPYPLDQNCHPQINRPFHKYACKAAYIAYCLKDQFAAVHDEFYDNQQNFASGWLDQFAKKYNVEKCVNSPKTKKAIVKFINFANDNYKINSTPTMIINGVKIEGGYPKELLINLLDELLKH